jgi:ATP-dependent DNA ligase
MDRVKPQFMRLVDEAPTGKGWLHEIKYDGYRMHARIDGGSIQLLTRTGLDWSHRYKRAIEALHSLKLKSAYLDGELCALNADSVRVFSRLPAAMDEGRTDQLVFFAFDLLSQSTEHGSTAARRAHGAAQAAVQEGDPRAAVQRACDWRRPSFP